MNSLSLFKLNTERQKMTLLLRLMQITAAACAGYLVLTSARNGIATAAILLSMIGLVSLVGRRVRYCPNCEANINRQPASLWCYACDSVVEPGLFSLGRNGVVELNQQTLSDDSQPMSKLIALLLGLAVRDKIQQVTIFKNGQVWFTTDTESFQLMPMPEHLVRHVKNWLRAIAGLGRDDTCGEVVLLEINLDNTVEQLCGKPQRVSGEADFASRLENQQIKLSLFHEAA